jgi:hypothetical protein
VKRPLFVFFSGEVGMDGGGLRRNFLSKIVDYGVRVFERFGTEVGLNTADVDDIYFMLSFYSSLSLSLLSNVKRWYGDGTFFITPKLFDQVFGIHAFTRHGTFTKQVNKCY